MSGPLNWLHRAACKGLGPDWFHAPERSVATRKALSVCADCPVRQECLEWIDELEQDETDPACFVGVYGGTTAKDRIERKANAIRRT